MRVIHYSLEQVHKVTSHCTVTTVFLISLKFCLLEKPPKRRRLCGGDQHPVFELTPLPFGTASLPDPPPHLLSPACSQFSLPHPEI